MKKSPPKEGHTIRRAGSLGWAVGNGDRPAFFVTDQIFLFRLASILRFRRAPRKAKRAKFVIIHNLRKAHRYSATAISGIAMRPRPELERE